ncbi:MAG TPA: ATP-binding protein [Ramlibacter sp.]|nr:ATP-binding protein [Ramlibacter sp.]
MLRPRSIRHKLNWVVLATTFVALSLAGVAMVVFDLRSYQQTWEHDLQAQADLIGLASAPALSFNDPKTARENLALLKVRPTITAAAIFTPQRELFAAYPAESAIQPLPATARDGVRAQGGELIAIKRIVNGGEFLGTVYLRAHHERLDRLRQYLAFVAVVIAVSMALALLLSNRLLSLVTRPILAVSDVARRMISGHDYSLRAVRTTDDEVGQVVDAFNELLDELARRAESLERVHQHTLDLNAQLEDRVKQRTAQLEMANRELEAFSYSASHDLRAPLHTIESFSSILCRSVASQLDERSRHYLDRIQVNARLMNKLIEALLVLAHVSRAPLERQPIDMSALAMETIEQCRGAEPGRDAAIEIASGMQARADATLVKQVVQNLIGNAWKFTAKVPEAKIAIGWMNGGDEPATFYVRDNGAGFDMAHADRLFSAFERLHSHSEFPGTGIGLATVHRIVTRHEGRIWAESAPAQGAAFYFTLDKA